MNELASIQTIFTTPVGALIFAIVILAAISVAAVSITKEGKVFWKWMTETPQADQDTDEEKQRLFEAEKSEQHSEVDSAPKPDDAYRVSLDGGAPPATYLPEAPVQDGHVTTGPMSTLLEQTSHLDSSLGNLDDLSSSSFIPLYSRAPLTPQPQSQAQAQAIPAFVPC